jgi:hypothetical protein
MKFHNIVDVQSHVDCKCNEMFHPSPRFTSSSTLDGKKGEKAGRENEIEDVLLIRQEKNGALLKFHEMNAMMCKVLNKG